MDNGKIVLFESSDGAVTLDVAVDTQRDEVWLNRNQMALLFARDVKTIGKHVANALKEELDSSRDSVVAKFATTASDGKTYQVEYYNLDVIISVGYRVKSQRASRKTIRSRAASQRFISLSAERNFTHPFRRRRLTCCTLS